MITLTEFESFLIANADHLFAVRSCAECPLAIATGFEVHSQYFVDHKGDDIDLPVWAIRFIETIDNQPGDMISGLEARISLQNVKEAMEAI